MQWNLLTAVFVRLRDCVQPESEIYSHMIIRFSFPQYYHKQPFPSIPAVTPYVLSCPHSNTADFVFITAGYHRSPSLQTCGTHVWSQGPGNMSTVCLRWCTGWLFLSECSTSSLWQSIVVCSTELQVTSPNSACQSLKFLVASICDLPDVINC